MKWNREDILWRKIRAQRNGLQRFGTSKYAKRNYLERNGMKQNEIRIWWKGNEAEKNKQAAGGMHLIRLLRFKI